MGSTGGCERMIAMLRRRLMGNMAKAKNIATGIARASTTQYDFTVTITGIGFRPDHVMMVTREIDEYTRDIWIYDDKVGAVYAGGDYTYGSCQFTPNSDGAQFTNVFTPNQNQLNGDYDFVAWQE